MDKLFQQINRVKLSRFLSLLAIIGGLWLLPLMVSRFSEVGDLRHALLTLALAAVVVLVWCIASPGHGRVEQISLAALLGLITFVGLYVAVPLTGAWRLPEGSTGVFIYAFPLWVCLVLIFSTFVPLRK